MVKKGAIGLQHLSYRHSKQQTWLKLIIRRKYYSLLRYIRKLIQKHSSVRSVKQK